LRNANSDVKKMRAGQNLNVPLPLPPPGSGIPTQAYMTTQQITGVAPRPQTQTVNRPAWSGQQGYNQPRAMARNQQTVAQASAATVAAGPRGYAGYQAPYNAPAAPRVAPRTAASTQPLQGDYFTMAGNYANRWGSRLERHYARTGETIWIPPAGTGEPETLAGGGLGGGGVDWGNGGGGSAGTYQETPGYTGFGGSQLRGVGGFADTGRSALAALGLTSWRI